MHNLDLVRNLGEFTPSQATELLERGDNLEALKKHLEAVRSTSRGRLVFLRGEAGVGKTSLVRSFTGGASRLRGILAGGCDPLFTPRPLGPLLAIADLETMDLEDRPTGLRRVR